MDELPRGYVRGEHERGQYKTPLPPGYLLYRPKRGAWCSFNRWEQRAYWDDTNAFARPMGHVEWQDLWERQLALAYEVQYPRHDAPGRA